MERKLLVHKVHGLSEIVDTIDINGKDYYKIKVLNEEKLTLYCPINRKGDLYRDIMTEKEAYNILDLMKNITDVEFDFSKQRRTHFKEMLFSGNPKNLAYLMRVLYIYKRYKDKKNQTLGLEDTRMLDTAETMLLDEISISLNIDRDKTMDFIVDYVRK